MTRSSLSLAFLMRGVLGVVFADYFGTNALAPTLPFHLETLGAREVELWTGAIMTAQFMTTALSAVVWGNLSDRFGPVRVLLVVLAGDGLFLGATAFAPSPVALLAIRVGVGSFSPLTAALAYMYHLSGSEDETTAALGMYAISMAAGYVLGAAFTTAIYGRLGWVYVQVGVAALVVLSAVLLLRSPPRCSRRGERTDATTPEDIVASVERLAPEGVRNALKTREYVTHAALAILDGWIFGVVVLAVGAVHLKQVLGFTPEQTGLVFVACPVVLSVSAAVLPAIIRWCGGLMPTIGMGIVGSTVLSALKTVPAVYLSPYIFPASIAVHVFFWLCQQLPNFTRAENISKEHTVNGTGAIAGVTSVLQAVGTGVSPILNMLLFDGLGPWAPWALLAFLNLAVALFHAALRVPLWKCPRKVAPVASLKAAPNQGSGKLAAG